MPDLPRCTCKKQPFDKHFKVMMRSCKRSEPPHPCDPKLPCDVCDEGDECPKPALCVERLNNPMEPYQTRCKPGKFLPAQACKRKDPPHPCDPPLPCIPGKPRKELCPIPSLCLEKVKNPESPFIRCPDPEDQYSEELCQNLAALKTPLPTCTKDPCAPPKLIDPFDSENDRVVIEEEVTVKDPNEYLYSRELCKHMNMLKQSIKTCFVPPCSQPILTDPFDPIDPESKYPDPVDPCNIDPRMKNKKK